MNLRDMKRPKVLVISGSFSGMRCGIGDYTRCLAKSLAGTGSMDIYVLTSHDASAERDSGFILFPSVTSWGFRAYKKILRLIKKIEPNLIHIQYPTIKYNKPYHVAVVLLPLMIKAFFPKVRIITTIHDFSIGNIISRIKQFPLLALSDAVIISNERDRDAMLKLYPYFQSKTKKIYIGSNIEFRKIDELKKRNIRKSLCPGGEKLIAYFGFFTRGKRIDLLLKSLKKLNERHLPSRLVMLGKPQTQKDLPYLNKLKALTDKLEIKDKVLWTDGPSDEAISAYLQCADLCILPFERGADLRRGTLICSIIHELPVVSTINKKYLVDRELDKMGAAKLIDLEKADFAPAVEELLKDDRAREEMICSMRQVKDIFSWYNVANSYLEIYNELIRAGK